MDKKLGSSIPKLQRMLVDETIITTTGGLMRPFVIEADGVDDVREAARERLKAGVDAMNLCTSGPLIAPLGPGEIPGALKISLEEMRAAVQEAPTLGKT